MDRTTFQRSVVVYLPLVRRIVRRLARRLPANVQEDDLLAVGVCGLVDSLRRSGCGGGASFEWYARTRIRGAIIDELRAQDWLSRRARASAGATTSETQFVSFEEASGGADGEDVSAGDLWEIVAKRSECRALERALEKLPARERIVIARHFFEEVRLRDIGVELGVSEPRISQLLSRALHRLRQLLSRAA